jgi:hypothetical protein
MSFRSDSLFHRVTEAQRDELMILISDTADGDRFTKGTALVKEWGVRCSRTAVHDLYRRYGFGWRLERGAAAAKFTENFSTYSEEQRKLVAQKLFEQASNVDCDPKTLIMIRSLEIEADKLKLAERSAKTRYEMETGKLKLAERRVSLLENKMTQASAKLRELRDPKKADDADVRKAILDKVDALMGIKAK